MDLYTGAAVWSVMSETECAKHFPHARFRKANVKLVTYYGTPIVIKGIVDVEVHYHDQCFQLPLVIAKETEGARMPTLFGRDWLSKIKFRWHGVVQVKALETTEKYRHVFEPGYREIKCFKASIRMKENAGPVFCKARPVPYAFARAGRAGIGKLRKGWSRVPAKAQ
ncbi:unnamed protein product [Ixodes persulcatus]